MGYYQGDYYQGDYYQGDPGFFSFLGRIAKGALGAVTGLGGGGGIQKMAPQTAITLASKARGAMTKIGPIVTRVAGSKMVRGAALGAAALGAGEMMARGFHVSRKSGKVVKNRRMRVTNPKALRRAIRRTHGFAKLAMRTIHLVHPKKRATFGGFKKKRRRAA